jgi:hypothetical protein
LEKALYHDWMFEISKDRKVITQKVRGSK